MCFLFFTCFLIINAQLLVLIKIFRPYLLYVGFKKMQKLKTYDFRNENKLVAILIKNYNVK